ncbi:hypothetical protein V1511DRAFT_504388 [Dipodascopsis uninucleata]
MPKSIQTFLASARSTVNAGIKASMKQKILLVTGNESADLDSFTSSLVYAYMTDTHPRKKAIYDQVIPILNIPREELVLRPDLHYLLESLSIPQADVICRDDFLQSLQPSAMDHLGNVDVALVDHNNLLAEFGKLFGNKVVSIIDHHEDEGSHLEADPRIISPVGSCTSLVVEYFKSYFLSGVSEEIRDIAQLALAPILVDTSDLTSKTTETDIDAVTILVKAISVACEVSGSDFTEEKYRTGWYNSLSYAKQQIDLFCLRDILRRDYKEFAEPTGLRVGISSSVKSLKWTVDKFGPNDFQKIIRNWAAERSLDLYVFMDSFSDPEEGHRRDLLVLPCSDAVKTRAPELISEAIKEFKLEPFKESEIFLDGQDFGYWKQRKTSASRKQIAPFVRRFLQ